MGRVNLTSKLVNEMPLEQGRQRLVYDKSLHGFGVRVGSTKKAYFAESRVAGKTRRVTIGNTQAFTADTARKEAKKIIGQMASGTDVNSAKAEARARGITVSEGQKAFFEGRKLKPRTEYDYQRVFTAYFADWSGRQLRDISPDSFLRRFRLLTEKNGPATANKAARIFQSMWNYNRASTARKDGTPVLPECPVRRVREVKAWNPENRRQTYLNGEMLQKWFSALDSLEGGEHEEACRTFKDYAELLLRTGLRRSEGAALRWENLDQGTKVFTVINTKNGSNHVLPMSRQVAAILERRYTMRTSEFVFPSNSKSGHLSDPRKFLIKTRKLIGQDWTWHDLRRTFATIAERLDTSHYALKRLLNHSVEDVTAGYLIHDPERLRTPMQDISDKIDWYKVATTPSQNV